MSLFVYPKIENYESILLIKEEKEMMSIISSSFDNIKTILKNILDRIKEQYIPVKEKNILLDTLKFIDNLNLFIDENTLKEFSKLMKKISSKLNNYKIKRIRKKTKNEIIAQIDFTELTFIKYRKSFYEKLFFKENNQNDIIKEIENDLQNVIKNEKYNWELLQQIQNIFWILKNKIENENEKKHLENKIKKIKKKINKYYYYNYYYYRNFLNHNEKYNTNEKHKKYKGENIAVEITTYFKSNNKQNIEEDKNEEISKNEILEKEKIDNPENNYLNGEENIINHRNNIITKVNFNENINDKKININNNELIINEIIDKNKINGNDKKEIKDETILFEEKMDYNEKNNIYDIYLNIKTLPNNIIIADLNNKNKINFKRNYFFDNNIIEENYKKAIMEFKKEKLNQIKSEI